MIKLMTLVCLAVSVSGCSRLAVKKEWPASQEDVNKWEKQSEAAQVEASERAEQRVERSSAPVHVSNQCVDAAAVFLTPYAPMGGIKDKKCLYSLYGLETLQKVDGGYIVRVAPQLMWPGRSTAGWREFGVAFLRTDDELWPQQGLSGDAKWEGYYKYVAVDGFARKVLAFGVD